MKNVYLQLLDELAKNQSLVLGTLLKTRGSTPQVPGASAIFNKTGLIFGTLGGGIMEAEALLRAKESIQTGQNQLEEYSLNADIDAEKGAICGGQATFLLDANPEKNLPVFLKLKNDIENRIPGVLVTYIEIKKNSQVEISRHWYKQGEVVPVKLVEKTGITTFEIQHILTEKKTGILNSKIPDSGEQKNRVVFVEPVYPKPELVIVGAGHVGQALCHFASLVDFDVTVIDNRADLATPERFPEAKRILNEDIQQAFKKINSTENTYIVIVTQGHRDDAVALKCCIKSDAAYIGMIGSKRKTLLMREKFIADGNATKQELDKIYAPIGIDIHSKTVNEIAVSIVAQLIQVRYTRQQKNEIAGIYCLVLAAGESKRMKKQKMLLPYQTVSIIETVLQKTTSSKAAGTTVVLGSDKTEIENQIRNFEVKIVENKNYQQGMLSSVQSGIKSLPAGARAVIILLGDQPMVKTETINKMIDEFGKNQKGLIIPVFSGKRGHPVLIDLKYREEIYNLNPEIGLRELMLNHSADIYEMEMETSEILNDIDTPEDYQRELTNLK